MEIGTNAFNDFEDFNDEVQNEVVNDTLIENNLEKEPEQLVEAPKDQISDEEIITEILRSKGILDRNKILYDDEEGEVEKNWNELSKEDKLGILLSEHNSEDGLDDSEIELINTIRNSKMSPKEYVQFIEKQGVDRYLQNVQTNQYSIDQYSDDDLFMYDMIAKFGDTVTDEEVQAALEQAKSNETLFKKLIDALRNEYTKAEQDRINQMEFEKKQAAEQLWNQFSNSIQDRISNFKDFYGCDINMDQDEMLELYEFITGFDAAGNNHFAKVLNDPDLLVKMAWTVLNGEQLISDINNYYKSEIAKVRKNSYEKGLKDANNKLSNFVIKENNDRQEGFVNLDDF